MCVCVNVPMYTCVILTPFYELLDLFSGRVVYFVPVAGKKGHLNETECSVGILEQFRDR